MCKADRRIFTSLAMLMFLISAEGCIKKKVKKIENENTDEQPANCDAAADPLCNAKLPKTETKQGSTLVPFENEQAWRDYMAQTYAKSRDNRKDEYGAQPASASANESITNVQETGVDEGGIVKNIGDYLVTLRKGRLASINTKIVGAPQQAGSIMVAPVASLQENVWYDEMLVKGNTIYVIGFRYASSGKTTGITEIHAFTLENGEFRRGSSLYMESSDYYSSSNYAARLTGETLLIYIPEDPFRTLSGEPSNQEQGPLPTLPRYLKIRDQNGKVEFVADQPILTHKDVYRPLELPTSPTVHMVVKCDLTKLLEQACQAKAILANANQTYYVSSDHIWLWTYPWLYAIPTDALVAKARLVKGHGDAVSQYGFKQIGNEIFVITKDVRTPKGSVFDAVDSTIVEPMGTGSPIEHGINLLQIPLAEFSGNEPTELQEQQVTKLFSSSHSLQVGTPKSNNTHIYIPATTTEPDPPSSGSGTSQTTAASISRLLSVELASKKSKSRDWEGQIVRIESAGPTNVLVIDAPNTIDILEQSQRKNLRFNIIGTDDELKPLATVPVNGISEGESRSHSYLWRDGIKSGEGLFGLAVINDENNRSSWLGKGISNIAFFSVFTAATGNTLQMAHVGTASSNESDSTSCPSSCVDWYGNSRPIFLGDRIFALQGDEFAEFGFTDGKVARKGNTLKIK